MDKELNVKQLILESIDTQDAMAKIRFRHNSDALPTVLAINEILRQLVVNAPEKTFDEVNKMLKELD